MAKMVEISKAEYEYILSTMSYDGVKIAELEAEIIRLKQELEEARRCAENEQVSKP